MKSSQLKPFLAWHLVLNLGVIGSFLMANVSASGVSAVVAGRPAGNGDPLTLWYASPAKTWTEALAIGNGRLGAMVFGVPDHERQQLNEITVWSGGPQPDQNIPDAYKNLPAIREALQKGDYGLAQSLTARTLTDPVNYDASYQTLGDLDIDYKLPDGGITDYWRWLDLNRAITGVEFKIGADTYRRESFSSAPDGVIVTHITSSRPGGVSFTLKLSRTISATTVLVGQDTLLMKGNTDYNKLKGNCAYEAQVRVLTQGGSVLGEGTQLMIQGADEATVLLAAGTTYVLDYKKNYRGFDPHDSVVKKLAAASAKSYKDLLAAHLADYQPLFQRVKFSLSSGDGAALSTDVRLANYKEGKSDPSLAELYYQMGRYLLISSSRPENQLPSNSQGIWGDGYDLPWKCDYKSNINYQMNYWPSETANLSECHLPALRLDASLVKPGTKTAQAYFNAPGWVCFYTTNAWGWTAPGNGLPWGAFYGSGAWLCQDFWEHYAFTRDREFLAKSYPILKGSAEFYLHVLVPNAEGNLITSPSLSPENNFVTDDHKTYLVDAGSACDREVIWDLFSNVIAASKVLGIDEDFRVRLQAAKDKIQPLAIGKEGQLEEWSHDWDMKSAELTHRHVSHLFAAFPGHQISPLLTPELAKAVEKTLDVRGDSSTGWSNAWKMNLWARLREGDHACKILNNQLKLANGKDIDFGEGAGGTYANMFDAHPPFQIDGNFGSVSGINEMLLQSSERYTDPTCPDTDCYWIDLLPALPSLWPSGSMHGLRARGGFQVDLDWESGQLKLTTITSIAGKSTRVRYNGNVVPLHLDPGQSISFKVIDGKLVAESHADR